MTNKEIASSFHELAMLMELYEENPFKIRSYENAYLAIRKMDQPLLEQTKEEWSRIKGIGSAIQEKLLELKEKGSFKVLEDYKEKTPDGIRQMLRIKGLGPKKVRAIWRELEIESPGELAYACEENRLIVLKGFGEKIQEEIRKNISFFNESSTYYLFSVLEREANELLPLLRELNADDQFELSGEMRRGMPTLEQMEIITTAKDFLCPDLLKKLKQERYVYKENFPVYIHSAGLDEYYFEKLKSTGGSQTFHDNYISKIFIQTANSEQELFEKNHLNYIAPECRDLDRFDQLRNDELIDEQSIYGVIHNHSTYSDGMYDIEAMAKECIRLGYKYLVMSDHSRSAFYANGLSIERVEQQWREIDELNIKLSPFKIFKSIESDILNDGSLDYPDEVLNGFDLVIASIHSNLKMDEEKAMMRLIRAIENPHTKILGHLTGRLLLSRAGYPVDHQKIIDACASNGVAIELNANPQRLDIDWTWIPYAMEKNVLVSINPDAHNLRGISDIRYGLIVARKAGLTKNNCLNNKHISEFQSWIS